MEKIGEAGEEPGRASGELEATEEQEGWSKQMVGARQEEDTLVLPLQVVRQPQTMHALWGRVSSVPSAQLGPTLIFYQCHLSLHLY